MHGQDSFEPAWRPGLAAGEAVPVTDRVPPHAYFLVSAVFHYLGPAFAVLLFARVDVLGVAWLRIAAAAAVFALWRRPWRTLARSTGAAAAARLGRRAGGDELLVLPRHRPAAAGHRGGDRVPAGGRAGRVRRAHAAQPRGAAAGRARRVPAHRRPARGRGARRGARVRQRRAVRALHRARPSRGAARDDQRDRRAGRLDAGRARGRDADGRLGGRAGARPIRSPCWRAWAWASRPR